MRPVRMALWHVFCNSASAGGAGGPAAAPSATGPGSSGAGREDGGSAGDTSPRPPAASGRAFEGAVLCNLAAGTDGWYPVAPFGDHPHPYGMQCLAPEDGATLVAWANGQGPDWTGVPVHANPAHPKDGPALAWVKRFRVLGNELQCLPEWSPAGEEAILVNRQFKRVTPCWTCEPGGDGKWHPVNLLHIGLTNAPNIKAARPWVNADGAADGDGSGGQPPEPPPRDQGGPSDSPEQGTAAGQPESRPPGAAAPVADASTRDRQASEPAAPAPAAADPGTGGGEALANAESAASAPDAAGEAGAAAAAASAGAPTDVGVRGSELPRPGSGAGSPELLARVAALENELAAVRSELAAEREFGNAAVVDLFIARRRVDPAKREAALAILANSREAALAVWGCPAGAVTGPAAGALPLRPPADPLAGRTFANAAGAGMGPAGGGRPGAEDLGRIVAASRRLQAERGLDPSAANDEAWRLFRNGALPEG